MTNTAHDTGFHGKRRKSISTRWFIEKPHIKTINFPFSKQPSFCFLLLFIFFTTLSAHPNKNVFCGSLQSHSNSPNFPFKSLNSYNNNGAKVIHYMLYGLLRCHNTNTMQPFVDWGFLTKKNLFFNIFQKDSHTKSSSQIQEKEIQ